MKKLFGSSKTTQQGTTQEKELLERLFPLTALGPSRIPAPLIAVWRNFFPLLTDRTKRATLNAALLMELKKPEWIGVVADLTRRIPDITSTLFSTPKRTLADKDLAALIPDTVLLLLSQYNLTVTVPPTIEALAKQCLAFVTAACRIEDVQVSQTVLSKKYSKSELDKILFLIECDVPGLLSKIKKLNEQKVDEIVAHVQAMKAKAMTAQQMEVAILEMMTSEKPQAMPTRTALSPTTIFLQQHTDFASHFQQMATLEWPTARLENIYKISEEVFPRLNGQWPAFSSAIKKLKFSDSQEQYIKKILNISGRLPSLDICIPDAVLMIADQYELLNKMRLEAKPENAAEQCKLLIEIGHYIEKHVKIEPNMKHEAAWKAQKQLCDKTYFLKILKEPQLLANPKIWIDLHALMQYLEIDTPLAQGNKQQKEQEQSLMSSHIHFVAPYLMRDITGVEALQTITIIRNKLLHAVDSQEIYSLKQQVKVNEKSNIWQGLLPHIESERTKFLPKYIESGKDCSEYFFDLVIAMILRYDLVLIIHQSKTFSDIIPQCLKIITVSQQVDTLLHDRKVPAQKHEQYKPLLMQLELRFAGSISLLKKINSRTLQDALLILDSCPSKSPEEIRDLLRAIGKKSAKELILRQMGITNLSSRSAVENVYHIYKEYEDIIDTYRDVQQQKVAFTMQRLEKSRDGRSFIVHHDESEDTIPLPHLAQELIMASVKTADALNKIKHVGLATNELVTVKNRLFKLYLQYKDENNLLAALDFERDDFLAEIERDFFMVEKHKSRFANHINQFYIPVLLLEHYMPRSAHVHNFLHKITNFNLVKDKVYLLVQSIIDIKTDRLVTADRARFFAISMVEYFNGIYPGTPMQLENFRRMCHAIKILSASNHLSAQEKDRIYLGLMNEMIQEQLMLAEDASITDICVYYNTMLSDGQDVGLELLSNMLIEKAAILSHANLDRYKKIDSALSRLFSQVSDPATLLRNKSKLVAIYAEYSDEKEPEIKFLEHYIKKYLVNSDTFDGFFQDFNAAHANVVAQLDKKGGLGFTKTTVAQRKKLLKAELYFPNILTHQKLQVSAKNIDALVANIRQIFELFDMDRHFLAQDDDGDKIDAQQNVIRSLLLLSHTSGKTVKECLTQAWGVLNIKEILHLDISDIKKLSQNEEKYQHLLSLMTCFIEYAPLDFIKYADKRDIHFHQRVLYAHRFTIEACDNSDAFSDRKKDLFNMALQYPELADACQTPDELSDMLTFVQDTGLTYAQDALKLQLYLMRMPNNPVALAMLTNGLSPDENPSASSSSSFSAWRKPAKASLLDDDDIPMTDFSAIKRAALKQQAPLYVAAFELIASSELQEADKERIRLKLAQYLQLSLTDDKKINVIPTDIISIYTLCDKLGLHVNQVLAFEAGRTLSTFVAEDKSYTHEILSGGRGNKGEWESEANQTVSFARVGFILSPDNQDVLPQIKAGKGANAYRGYRANILRAIYKGEPTAEQQETYAWHEASYGAFDTNTPFKFYLAVNKNCETYTILTPHGSCQTGVIVTDNAIYNVSHMPAQSPIDDFDDLQGKTTFAYKVGATGYHIDHMVHQGTAFYIDYARITYFYNAFGKYSQYAIVINQNDREADAKVVAALQKQIAVLRGADRAYLAFYPVTHTSSANTDLLRKLQEQTGGNPSDLYCFDSYNGKAEHRSIFEGWLHILNEEVILFTPEFLKYYAQVFNYPINKKEDMSDALYHISRLKVQSELQQRIFAMLADFIQGKANTQVCLQNIIDAKECDLEGRYEALFAVCNKQLAKLNKNNPLALEIDALIGSPHNATTVLGDALLNNYLTGIGNPQAKISQKLLDLFQAYALVEEVKSHYQMGENKQSLNSDELLQLLRACHELEKTLQMHKTSKAEAKFLFVTALNYPGLLLQLPAQYNTYSIIARAQKTLDAEFQGVLNHMPAAMIPEIKTQLMYNLCINPEYKLKLLSEMGLPKDFSHKPSLRDELLAIHLQYNQGLAAFFTAVKIPAHSDDLFTQIKSVVNATQKYWKAFNITDKEAIQDVFLMQLHSLTYYPQYKNSLAFLLGRERDTNDGEIKTIAGGDTFEQFIHRHEKFAQLWHASKLNESPVLNGLPIRERVELRNKLIELQRMYDENSTQYVVIDNFFRNLFSGYIPQVDKYTDLHHVASFMKQTGKDQAQFKQVCDSVFAHTQAQQQHPLLRMFRAIRQNDFLQASEKEKLYKIAYDRYQKHGLGQDDTILYIAQDVNIYPLLLLLNQTDLIFKYRVAIGATFAVEGMPLDAAQLLHLHEMHLDTITATDKTKKTRSANDEALFTQMLALAKLGIDMVSVIAALNEYQPHVALYLSKDQSVVNVQKVLDIRGDINSYIGLYPEIAPLKHMLFFISLFDASYTLSQHSEKDIHLRYNKLQQTQQHQVNPKIIELGGFEKLSADLKLPIEKIVGDQKLKRLVDVYCEGALRPVLLAHRKKMPVDMAGDLISYQPYYAVISAYEVLNKQEDFNPGQRAKYFTLLLCSEHFEICIDQNIEVDRVYHCYTQVNNNLNNHHMDLTGVDKFYLTCVLLTMPDFGPQTLMHLDGNGIKDTIALGILLASEAQLKLKPTKFPLSDLNKKTIAVLKTVYESGFDEQTKTAIYLNIVQNPTPFEKTDDLYTICDKANQKLAYEKVKQTSELALIAATVSTEKIKRKMQHATEQIESYMQDRRVDFLGTGELEQIKYARMQYAYIRHPAVIDAIFSKTKHNINLALIWNIFDRIINADYALCVWMNQVFDNSQHKNLKSLSDRLFRIELAFPGMLDVLSELESNHLRDLESDAARATALSGVIALIEGLVDLNDPIALFKAQASQHDIELIVRQEARGYGFYKAAHTLFEVDKYAENEEIKKILPALLACYAKYSVQVQFYMQQHKKYFSENFLAGCHYIINATQGLDKVIKQCKLKDNLLRLYFHYPMFAKTEPDEHYIKQLDEAFYKIKMDDRLMPYAAFCIQFSAPGTVNEVTAKMNELFIKDKKFATKLSHLASYIDMIQGSHLTAVDKKQLSADLVKKFMVHSDAYFDYKPFLSHAIHLAKHEYELSFSVDKSSRFKNTKDVIEYVFNHMSAMRGVDNYQGLSFDAGLFVHQAKRTDTTLTIPACLLKVNDGYHKATTGSAGGLDGVEHTHIEINAGVFYIGDSLPNDLSSVGEATPAQLSVQVTESGNEFRVKVAAPAGAAMHVMAILTAYDGFVKKFVDKSPGMSYLSLGTLQAKNAQYFSPDGKVFHDKALWRAGNLAAYNYNSIASELASVHQAYRGREGDQILKLNYAARMFAEGLALFAQRAPIIHDHMHNDTLTHSVNLPPNGNQLPKPLQTILDNLIAFDSYSQFEQGILCGENMRSIAEILGVRFELGKDNIATLLTQYKNGFLKSAFSDALYDKLSHFMSGMINAPILFKALKNMAELPCANPKARDQLFMQMAKLEVEMDKFIIPARLVKYCEILGVKSDTDDSLQQVLSRAGAINFSFAHQHTFFTALREFASMRITAKEFESVYHDAKYAARGAEKNKVVLDNKTKIDLPVERYNHLLGFLREPGVSILDLNTLQNKLHELFEPKGKMYQLILQYFTVPDKLILPQADDFDARTMTRVLLVQFIESRETDEFVGLKQHINNWLYLYDYAQQLAIYEDAGDIAKLERALKLPDVEFQQREASFLSLGASKGNSASSSSHEVQQTSMTHLFKKK